MKRVKLFCASTVICSMLLSSVASAQVLTSSKLHPDQGYPEFSVTTNQEATQKFEDVTWFGTEYSSVVYTVPKGTKITVVGGSDYPALWLVNTDKNDWKLVDGGVVMADGTLYTDGRDPGVKEPSTAISYVINDSNYSYVLEPNIVGADGTAVLCFIRVKEGEKPATNKVETEKVASKDNADSKKANISNVNVKIADSSKELSVYNIEGNNYFMLRDVAMLLKGTEKEFSIDFLSDENKIVTKINSQYVPSGSELKTDGKMATANATKATVGFVHNDLDVQDLISGYNINGSNYYKLRDLGDVFDFNVAWNESTKTIKLIME